MDEQSQLKTWEDQARIADELQRVIDSGAWNVLDVHIFKEIEDRAFRTIRNPEFNLGDLNQLYQFRAMCQSIDQVRRSMNIRITQGREARAHLKEFNSTQEGEPNAG